MDTGRAEPRGARLHDRGAQPQPSSGNEPYTGGHAMPATPQWRFDRFRLDPDHACLWCEAQAMALPPKAFAVLRYLVTHPDRLVPKDELLDAVWPETAVSDAVVRVAIGALRKVLGDTAQTPRFIATVPRRGYRFLAPVEEHTDVAPGAVPVPAGSVPPVASQL